MPARAVAGFCLRQYPAAERVVVLCGKGNNGGGWVGGGASAGGAGGGRRVVLLGREDEVKGEAAVALERLRRRGSGCGPVRRGRWRRRGWREDVRRLRRRRRS